ncbi:MAG: hypothetical protein FWC68_01640 [Oscillospiraceae bacterium]|nr:hypothetical protein [Oscillospiraceae bacterium]
MPITGYTKHGINSAINHNNFGVSQTSILNTVINPIQTIQQANGVTKFVGVDSVVILNSSGKVITTWPTSSGAYRIP